MFFFFIVILDFFFKDLECLYYYLDYNFKLVERILWKVNKV